MSKFKVGDRVRAKGETGTGVVIAVKEYEFQIRWDVLEDVTGWWPFDHFDLVQSGPVRTVTRKEIVEGGYSRLGTLRIAPSGVSGNSAVVSLEARFYTAADLREIGELIAATADALDEVAA